MLLGPLGCLLHKATSSRSKTKPTYLIHRNKYKELGKMRRQRNIFQMKELDKTPEEKHSEEEFKVMTIKMQNVLGRRMDEHSEKFSKELQNIEKNRTELKDIITEIKNTLEGINSKLDVTEE